MSEKKIKSAVELALEKTVGMRATREEMRALENKELIARTKGLVSKYLEGEKALGDLERELGEAREKERGLMRSTMLESLLLSIEPGADCAQAIEGLAALAGENAEADVEKLKGLLHDFNLEYSQAKEKRNSTILGELKERGVWGSALLPNLRDDGQWHSESENLRALYNAKLDKLRAALLKAASSYRT